MHDLSLDLEHTMRDLFGESAFGSAGAFDRPDCALARGWYRKVARRMRETALQTIASSDAAHLAEIERALDRMDEATRNRVRPTVAMNIALIRLVFILLGAAPSNHWGRSVQARNIFHPRSLLYAMTDASRTRMILARLRSQLEGGDKMTLRQEIVGIRGLPAAEQLSWLAQRFGKIAGPFLASHSMGAWSAINVERPGGSDTPEE